MAIIASKILWWSRVDDATAYRLRIVKDGLVTPDLSNLIEFPYDVIGQSPLNEVEADIQGLSVTPPTEGIYDLFISAVDEAGNESDPLLIGDALLDFQPPATPANGGFR